MERFDNVSEAEDQPAKEEDRDVSKLFVQKGAKAV
jgi:hypothetical protein